MLAGMIVCFMFSKHIYGFLVRPLAVAMGLAGTAVVAVGSLGIMSLPTNVYTGIAKYPLMAIPVFVIAGLIFERAGVAAGIVRFASRVRPRKSHLRCARICAWSQASSCT